jgi:hypothetical protein
MGSAAVVKGTRLENRLAEALSVWVSTHLKEDYRKHFRGEPSSGANAANHLHRYNSKYSETTLPAEIGVADIHPLTPDAHEVLNIIAFECKNYDTLEWGRLLFTPTVVTSTNTIAHQCKYHRSICKQYQVVPVMVYNETHIRSGEPVMLIPRGAGQLLLERVAAVHEAYLGCFTSIDMDVFRMSTLLYRCPYPVFIEIFTTYKETLYGNT